MKKRTKLLRIVREVLIGLLLLFFFSLVLNWYRAPKAMENALSQIKGMTLHGKRIQSYRRQGEPLMIHFWGTWCPVCRQEASNIGRVARHYPVITVAVQSGTKGEILDWMKRQKVDYPILNDPDGTLAKRFGVSIFPTTFILSPDGQVKFTETGYTTTAGLLARMKLAE